MDSLTNFGFMQENATMHHFSDTVFVLDQQTIFVSDSDEEPEAESKNSMDDGNESNDNDELIKLESELEKAKHELHDIVDSHNDQIDDFQSMLENVQTQSESIGVIKEKRKQRSSIKQIEINYENELLQSQQIKKDSDRYKLDIKLKDQQITQLTQQNEALKIKLSKIENNHEMELEKLNKEYNQQIESEINKRTAQISQLKQQKNAEIDVLNKQKINSQQNLNENENDKLINSLKSEIKKLEKRYDEEQEMFFKHSEIFDHKLERETKERKRTEKQSLKLKVEYDIEINELKQRLSKINEINIVLQQHLEIIIDENTQLKNMANHGILQELQNTNKEKEEELNKVKEFMKEKENENKTLRISVNSHNKTIKELETMLNGLKTNENKFENKKKQIDDLNEKINHKKRQSLTINSNLGLQIMDFSSNQSMQSMNSEKSMKIGYNKLKNEMKNKYQKLQNKYKESMNHVYDLQQLLQEIEISKLVFVTNVSVEMDRMREEIRKQNLLFIHSV